MAHFQTQIKAGRETLKLAVEVDKRLRTTARWVLHGDTITLRVPTTMTRDQINQIIADIAPRIARQRKRAVKQSDTNLTDRARMLNAQYFNNELAWHSIRWVKNMDRRLGSCTTGGTTDGDIRISERIARWPDYVIDYVIAHEICHRKYPNHSAEFWSFLARYPHATKALGFIEGIAYAEGGDPDLLMD